MYLYVLVCAMLCYACINPLRYCWCLLANALLQESHVPLVKLLRLFNLEKHARIAMRQSLVAVKLDVHARLTESICICKCIVSQRIDATTLNDCKLSVKEMILLRGETYTLEEDSCDQPTEAKSEDQTQCWTCWRPGGPRGIGH